MLDEWSSYTVTVVWELAWADSVFIVLDKWLSYRGGHISSFDCTSDFTVNLKIMAIRLRIR